MGKEDVVLIDNGILLSQKKNETMQFAGTQLSSVVQLCLTLCRNTGGPKNYNTKQSQTEKDKYPMVSLMWNLKKKDTDELLYKTEIDSQSLKTNVWLPKGKCGG